MVLFWAKLFLASSLNLVGYISLQGFLINLFAVSAFSLAGFMFLQGFFQIFEKETAKKVYIILGITIISSVAIIQIDKIVTHFKYEAEDRKIRAKKKTYEVSNSSSNRSLKDKETPADINEYHDYSFICPKCSQSYDDYTNYTTYKAHSMCSECWANSASADNSNDQYEIYCYGCGKYYHDYANWKCWQKENICLNCYNSLPKRND